MKTILIEKTAKRIKLMELITLFSLFSNISIGLWLMYLWLPLGVVMFGISTLSILAFITVRIYRWWKHE